MAKEIYIGVEEKLEVLDYIESTGTQYIDTGIPANINLKVIADVMPLSSSYPFGVAPSQNVKYYGMALAGTNNAVQGYLGSTGTSGTYPKIDNLWKNGERYTLIANDSKKFYINNTLVANYNTTNNILEFSDMPITICALNGAYLSTRISMRIYAFDMYDNGILVRNYIPVKREDGTCCLYDKVSKRLFLNKGTGEFIEGKNTGEIIVNSKARRVKKIYTGIDNVARKVIKGYIGINGIARQFFSSQKGVSYYGPGTPLSQARSVISGISFNDYAIFAGGAKGFWGTETSYSLVETYNKNLTKNNITNLSSNRRSMMSGKNENYAIFAGGYSTSASTKVATVDAYDKTLTRTTATSLGTARYSGAAATINNNIIIAGGSNYSTHQNVAEAYDSNLTRKSVTSLSVTGASLGANSNSKYAIFGGGATAINRNNVDAYNSSLVKTTATALSVARGNPVAVTMNDLVLFVGGGAGSYGENDPSKVIDAYDSNLVRTTPATLSEGKVFFAGDTCNDYAVFAGNRSTTSGINVDVFDSNLVRTTTNNLSVERGWLAAASTGNYIIFAGGQTGELLDTVDVYEVN